MNREFRAGPGPEEAAAIVAALEAPAANDVETEAAAAPPSGWRLAARAFDAGWDAERALRRALRRTI
jgi:hypothetical protein